MASPNRGSDSARVAQLSFSSCSGGSGCPPPAGTGCLRRPCRRPVATSAPTASSSTPRARSTLALAVFWALMVLAWMVSTSSRPMVRATVMPPSRTHRNIIRGRRFSISSRSTASSLGLSAAVNASAKNSAFTASHPASVIASCRGRTAISFSWLVVAVGAADPVVGVSQLVLGDVRGTVVRCEHQVLLEQHGPELPAGRGPQAAAKVGEALVGLAGVNDEADGLHDPRIAVRVVQDEGQRALIDPELGVAPALDRFVGYALVLAELFGHLEPHDPARFEPQEIALCADHHLDPVKTPEPRAVLERAKNVILPGERLHIDLIEHRLGGGIPGSVGVVEPDRVVDPGVDVVDYCVPADQEDLRVPLAADVIEAHELGVGVIVWELGGEQLHSPLLSLQLAQTLSFSFFVSWALTPGAGRDPVQAQFSRSIGG